MSFRIRVLVLAMLVALTAVGATAVLTVRQMSGQLNRTVSADQARANQIAGELRKYASTHGTWEGVADQARLLSQANDIRIKLITVAGETIVDTDTLNGRSARGTPAPPILVDPRPVPKLPADANALKVGMTAIDQYRRGIRLAACLTRLGVQVRQIDGADGIPSYQAVGDNAGIRVQTKQCLGQAISAGTEVGADERALVACLKLRQADQATCLREVFRERIDPVAPVPLQMFLGATNDPVRVAIAPILYAAIAVFLLALIGALLVSRRVVRPVAALTVASRRLGRGDLSSRVPVTGNDEIAGLGRSFNRMADSLQAAEERQRRMIADAAHELRTPLANLRGYLEALQDGVIAPSAELFASLHDEAVLQQRIVNDLQDLAQAEAGTLVYHREAVDAAELLELTRTAHQAVAEAAGVQLALSAAGPLPVFVDQDRIRQVLGNLVTNAVRATPPGGQVTLSGQPVPGGAMLAVTDTGHGIAEADLPHVFDRFWRADAARGRRTGGSGLGLAIAREIVGAHGGTIRVASRVNVGTTFTIYLPS